MTEKRDIQAITSAQVQHLDKILDKKDIEEFRKLIPELKDTWVKKQIYRTETEMRLSVLNDGRHPTKGSKYWQCVREQSVHFEQLLTISFQGRRNAVAIKKIKKDLEKCEDPLEVELQEVDLDEKIYQQANMELVAKDRMREIEHWSRLKKELDDGTFDTQNVNTHQTKAYAGFLSNKKKSLRETTAAEDVFNVLTQLSTLHRLKKEGVLKENEKNLSHDKTSPKLSK